MRSYKELAEMTGTTVDEVRAMMRSARKVHKQRCVKPVEYELYAVWCVGISGTGCIGSGSTREEAVIYALENNVQFAAFL
jgi:hypothetical protein|nr:MAG TPA: RNA polymerase sigma-H factor [Caudoviricetes sp.]